jgi:SAM-dependent methyltransferase
VVVGRRAVRVDEQTRWIGNRVADVYDARPEYPEALIDAVARYAPWPRAHAGDLGAGTGRLALPLAARGLRVTAIEPAEAMLERLVEKARASGLDVTGIHAAAEEVPLPAACLDLAVVADAVHFLDAELTGRELERLLAPRAGLVVVTSAFADTPFMRAVQELMQSAAPRRPREVSGPVAQLFGSAAVRIEDEASFADETPVDDATLEAILRSISFIGPAMSPARATAFHARVRALPGPRVWARVLTVFAGRRGKRGG